LSAVCQESRGWLLQVESLNLIDFRLPVSKHKRKHGFNEASINKAWTCKAKTKDSNHKAKA